ncbi:hypothetical protein EHS25_006666 [Saitozyma podzolica]|uniref:Uncharacterized protein n=1 Tax=Saitozyma podzolica TaxID=1890683 RepID=A0A427YSB3_9TREE|nr:hypothetical protein EHS25_006666 [Saitozyma podzolica]
MASVVASAMTDTRGDTDDALGPVFPNEIICIILDHLAQSHRLRTIASLLQCSHGTYDLVSPYLYRELVLTRSNARGVFCGLATPPPRLRRTYAKKASAPGDINWRRFLSQDFYLEWARIYEAAPNEGLRSRREYLVWPNADADSGDEASASSNGQGEARVRDQVGTGRLAWPHPTYASHRRKLALLELTERLCVQDTPGTDLCDELDCINRAGGTIIFPTLKYLSLSSKAYWTLSDWEDRHVLRSHPFTSVLADSEPEHICVHYPSVDQWLERRYMMARVVTNEEHLSRDSEVDQYTYLRFRLQRRLRHLYGNSLRKLVVGGHTKSLTVHNVAMEDVPSFPGVPRRVFFHPCSCRDEQLADPVVDTSCYNHFEPENRIRWIVAKLMSYREGIDNLILQGMESLSMSPAESPEHGHGGRRESPRGENSDGDGDGDGDVADPWWELVDADWLEAAAWPLERSVREDVAGLGLWARTMGLDEHNDHEAVESLLRRVTFRHSGEAEPCICCGKKQLSYAEVRKLRSFFNVGESAERKSGHSRIAVAPGAAAASMMKREEIGWA